MGLFSKIANAVWNGLRPAREPVHTCTLIRIEETALHLSGTDPNGGTFHHSVDWNGFEQAICRLQSQGDSIYLRKKDRTEYFLSSGTLSRVCRSLL